MSFQAGMETGDGNSEAFGVQQPGAHGFGRVQSTETLEFQKTGFDPRARGEKPRSTAGSQESQKGGHGIISAAALLGGRWLSAVSCGNGPHTWNHDRGTGVGCVHCVDTLHHFPVNQTRSKVKTLKISKSLPDSAEEKWHFRQRDWMQCARRERDARGHPRGLAAGGGGCMWL